MGESAVAASGGAAPTWAGVRRANGLSRRRETACRQADAHCADVIASSSAAVEMRRPRGRAARWADAIASDEALAGLRARGRASSRPSAKEHLAILVSERELCLMPEPTFGERFCWTRSGALQAAKRRSAHERPSAGLQLPRESPFREHGAKSASASARTDRRADAGPQDPHGRLASWWG